MPELKPISMDGVPRALAKAERYRLLNEPRDAESICRDILRTDPDNQDAVVVLLLSLTDQFGRDPRVNVGHAREMLPRIANEYKRRYYEGVAYERWAKALLHRRGAEGNVVYQWLKEAMAAYERAEKMRPKGDEDPILRWNACARIIRRHDQLQPRAEEGITDEHFQDDVPV